MFFFGFESFPYYIVIALSSLCTRYFISPLKLVADLIFDWGTCFARLAR